MVEELNLLRLLGMYGLWMDVWGREAGIRG